MRKWHTMGESTQQKVRAPVPTSTAWVYCSSRSSILEMGRAGWDLFTLLLGREGSWPRALPSALCLTLSTRHSSLGPQTSTSWAPSSAFPWRTLGPAFPWRTWVLPPLENHGSCLGSSQTYLFLMERFRDSVLSLSCGVQAEMEPRTPERGPEPPPHSRSPCPNPRPTAQLMPIPGPAERHMAQRQQPVQERGQAWGGTYFGAGAQGRRAHFSPLQDQGAGCPGLSAALVQGAECLGLGLDHCPLVPLLPPPRAPADTAPPWASLGPLPPDVLWF